MFSVEKLQSEYIVRVRPSSIVIDSRYPSCKYSRGPLNCSRPFEYWNISENYRCDHSYLQTASEMYCPHYFYR